MSDGFDPYRKWLGIPPEEQPPNFYRLLGIPLFETDPDVIENAAHRQMAYVRTFQTGRHAEQSQRLLNELAAAKVCLMNVDRKAAYDADLHRAAADGGPLLRGDSAIGAASLRGSHPGGSSTTPQFAVAPPATAGSTTAGSTSTFVPAPSTGAARRPGGSRARRGERRNVLFLSALFGGLGVVAVIVIVVLLAVNYRLQKGKKAGGGDVAGTPGGSSASSSGGGGGSKSSGSGSPATPSSGATSPSGASGSTGSTEKSPASGSTDKSQTLANREDRVRAALKRVREMLAERDFNRAKTTLNSAGVPVRNVELRAEYDRVEVFITYYSEFWRAVRSGANKVARPKSTEDSSKSSSDSKSGDAKPGDSKPGDSKSADSKPGDSKSGDSKSASEKSSDAKSTEAKDASEKQSDSKRSDSKTNDSKPDGTQQGEAKSNETKSNEAKPNESKSSEAKSSDSKTDGASKSSSDSSSRRRDFAFRGSTYEVLEADRDHLKLLVNGEEQTWTMGTIPPKAAVAIALQGVRADDPFINIYAATFLMFDQRGDLEENRRIAAELWNEARRRTGVPNKFLQDEFNLKSDDGN